MITVGTTSPEGFTDLGQLAGLDPGEPQVQRVHDDQAGRVLTQLVAHGVDVGLVGELGHALTHPDVEVVEDDAAIRESIADFLGDRGYRVAVAGSIAGAERARQDQHFAAVHH